MALYTIPHHCGHHREIQIYGTNGRGERERRAARETAQPCPDCRRAAQSREAQAVAGAIGLPDLTGSDKQVAWAARIRDAALTELDKIRTELSEIIQANPTEADKAEQILRHIDQLLATRTSAAWWIDNRSQGGGITPRISPGFGPAWELRREAFELAGVGR